MPSHNAGAWERTANLQAVIALVLANYGRFIAYGVAVLAVASTIWLHGYGRGVQKLYDFQVAQATEAVKVIVKQGAVTERVVTKFIKVQGRTRVITNTIEKEVVKYAAQNTTSCLDTDWGRLHDAAATRAFPEATGPADGASGAPTAAAALETATGNYAKHHACVDRLDALQEWVKAQAEL